jgi:hypothetical protein
MQERRIKLKPNKEKALIAGNNQGLKFQTSGFKYITTARFLHLSFADFPTNAPIKAGVTHAN